MFGPLNSVVTEYTGAMSYALIEMDTGNIVGFFSTEHAALEDVLDSINRYGVKSVETLGLGFNDPIGPVHRIAAGTELAQRALATSVSVGGRLGVVRGGRSSAHAAAQTADPSTPNKAASKMARSARAVTPAKNGRTARASSHNEPNPPPEESPKR